MQPLHQGAVRHEGIELSLSSSKFLVHGFQAV